MNYPSTLHKLIERSKKRRTLLRQYKFESLKEIINLTEDKSTEYEMDLKREDLYEKIRKKLNLDNEAHAHAAQRIKSLRTIAQDNLQNDVHSMNSSKSINSPNYILEQERKKAKEERKKKEMINNEIKFDAEEKKVEHRESFVNDLVKKKLTRQ